jgi:hypothetical protein
LKGNTIRFSLEEFKWWRMVEQSAREAERQRHNWSQRTTSTRTDCSHEQEEVGQKRSLYSKRMASSNEWYVLAFFLPHKPAASKMMYLGSFSHRAVPTGDKSGNQRAGEERVERRSSSPIPSLPCTMLLTVAASFCQWASYDGPFHASSSSILWHLLSHAWVTMASHHCQSPGASTTHLHLYKQSLHPITLQTPAL